MSPYFKTQIHPIVLVVIVVTIALIHRLHVVESPPAPSFQQSTVQKTTLDHAVRGSIGISDERGDSVYVVKVEN